MDDPRGTVTLTRRQLSVLREVVERHIDHGGAVASGPVAASPRVGLSPATVRGVMAALEEQGLLTRAHPSAGCLPTDAAYRVYIEKIARRRVLAPRAKHVLAARFSALRRELVEDLEWVARLLAEATNETALAVRPLGEQPTLRAISLVPLSGRRVLAVLVTADGAVVKRVIRIEEELDEGALQEAANFFGRELAGRSLADAVSELERQAVGSDPRPEAERALGIARALLAEPDGDAEILVAGTDRLLGQAEFAGPHEVRSVLEVLEDRRQIVSEWRRALEADRTQVILGGESEVTAAGNLGMVATLFFRDGRRAGAVGVVGPRRMDYLRIVPLVEYIGETLTTMLEGVEAGNA